MPIIPLGGFPAPGAHGIVHNWNYRHSRCPPHTCRIVQCHERFTEVLQCTSAAQLHVMQYRPNATEVLRNGPPSPPARFHLTQNQLHRGISSAVVILMSLVCSNHNFSAVRRTHAVGDYVCFCGKPEFHPVFACSYGLLIGVTPFLRSKHATAAYDQYGSIHLKQQTRPISSTIPELYALPAPLFRVANTGSRNEFEHISDRTGFLLRPS